ncbi:MAG TPA: ribonuclease III [Thermoanaerobaculia bacterium]|nr:ribonuclease III [Thermoanaerobaculia bacterium]
MRLRLSAVTSAILVWLSVDAHEQFEEFEERLGYRFTDRTFLIRGLTHKSFAHEARNRGMSDNETYEFFGDSILGFVIGELLFRRFPGRDEGDLSKMKSFLVSSTNLAPKARELRMGEVLLLGVGEERSGGRKKDSLLANLFEAIVASVYLDGGLEPVARIVHERFRSDIEAIDENDLLFQDYKTALQEWAQGKGMPLPEYSVIEEIGPDHDKKFVVEVNVNNRVIARGTGSSKKEAQQQAAKEALVGAIAAGERQAGLA